MATPSPAPSPAPAPAPAPTTSVSITTTVIGSNWTIQANLIAPAQIPLDVFIYENTGTPTLGAYFGVVNLQDYSRIQTWTGVAIPIFGNKYVKYTQANLVLPLDIVPATISLKLKSDLTKFKLEYLASASTTEIAVV